MLTKEQFIAKMQDATEEDIQELISVAEDNGTDIFIEEVDDFLDDTAEQAKRDPDNLVTFGEIVKQSELDLAKSHYIRHGIYYFDYHTANTFKELLDDSDFDTIYGYYEEHPEDFEDVDALN